MALALSNITETRENLETYCLIWLDAHVNNSHENRQAQQQLQAIINHLLTFEDDQQCLQHIEKLRKDDRIILIVSGRSGRKIVAQIVQRRQIASIYVYCFDKAANDQWAQNFTKIKGVIIRLPELIQRIDEDYKQLQHSTLDESFSVQVFNKEPNDQFIQSQLLLDCLIRMEQSTTDNKQELIAFCEQYYKNNSAQLMIVKEFEKSYSSERVLSWFTRQAFLLRLLNKALREQNIDVLVLFRFIIHDIGYQLGTNQCSLSIRVYRSQLISKDELQLLINATGQIISVNSFLSASYNRKRTRALLDTVDLSNDTEKIFFEIKAKSHLYNMRPFGSIPLKTDEILFMIGSIFRLDKIDRDNDKIWKIQMSVCSVDDQHLKPFVEQMKSQLGMGKTNLFQLGQILRRMGKLTNAERYYRRYLNQLPDGHEHIASCYHVFGLIGEAKNDFSASLKWYKKALATQQPTSPDMADIDYNIASMYAKTGDYTNAMKSYETALEIWTKTLGENHPRVGQCLNSIGETYEINEKYSEALECYQKAKKILKKSLLSKDADIAITNRYIGNVYELMADYPQALIYYEKALKIFRHSLPASQIHVNDMEKSIRRISSKLG